MTEALVYGRINCDVYETVPEMLQRIIPILLWKWRLKALHPMMIKCHSCSLCCSWDLGSVRFWTFCFEPFCSFDIFVRPQIASSSSCVIRVGHVIQAYDRLRLRYVKRCCIKCRQMGCTERRKWGVDTVVREVFGRRQYLRLSKCIEETVPCRSTWNQAIDRARVG